MAKSQLPSLNLTTQTRFKSQETTETNPAQTPAQVTQPPQKIEHLSSFEQLFETSKLSKSSSFHYESKSIMMTDSNQVQIEAHKKTMQNGHYQEEHLSASLEGDEAKAAQDELKKRFAGGLGGFINLGFKKDT